MPRPLRSFEPGGYYHITARGNNGHDIVVDNEDRAAFVALLDRTALRFRLRVHAWCLLTNHYHLVVQTPDAGISKALHHLNGRYAKYFNERHGRSGHLFNGRFRATVLEDEAHFEAACVYVLLNPVRAGLVAGVDDWRWAGAVGSPA